VYTFSASPGTAFVADCDDPLLMERSPLKKILCVLPLLLISFPFTVLAETVVDVYKALPTDLLRFEGNQARYELANKDGKWLTKSSVGYEFEVVVDAANGYLEINDRGTGGGFVAQELALLATADGGTVIGVNIYCADGTQARTKGLRFYRRDGNRFRDVTKDVLPELDWKMFYRANQWNIEDLKQGAKIAAREKIALIRFKLPRNGTMLRASFLKENLIIRGQYTTSGLTAAEGALLAGMVNTLARDRIMLKWDAAAARFVLPGSDS